MNTHLCHAVAGTKSHAEAPCRKCGSVDISRVGKGAKRRCRNCLRRYAREYQRAHRNEARRRRFARDPHYFRRAKLRQNYGLSFEDYDAMHARQKGCCAICLYPEGSRKLCVDHDHSTGEIRALLCSGCNAALGSIENTEWLGAAIAYLRGERIWTQPKP